MVIVTPVPTQTGTLGASAIADSTGGSVRTPYRPQNPRAAYAQSPAPTWNGEERRKGEDRRLKQSRRQEQVTTPLNTRAGQDRRRQGRRADDLPEHVSLSILA